MWERLLQARQSRLRRRRVWRALPISLFPPLRWLKGFPEPGLQWIRGAAIAGMDDVEDLMDPGAPTTNEVKIKVAITNFPDGGKVEWPETVYASADLDIDGDGDW